MAKCTFGKFWVNMAGSLFFLQYGRKPVFLQYDRKPVFFAIQWGVPNINFMFVIHKHLFVISVCDTQICGPKTNFVFVNHKRIVNS
jgi:hypothetical protein